VTEPPHLSSPRATNGVFALMVKGARGFQYEIQSSTNAHDWARAGSVTVTNFSGRTEFAEPLDASVSLRLYRAVSP